MPSIKTLVSGLTAAAVVAGYAYAQSTSTDQPATTPPAATDSTTAAPANPAPTPVPGTDSSTSTASPSSSDMAAERAAQADRN